MSYGYTWPTPLHSHWGFQKDPFRDAGETITPHDLQKILYKNLGFERSLDEVPLSLCKSFCAWPEQGGIPTDILILRFNVREAAYNKGSKQPRDLYDILINLCLKIYSKLPHLLPLKEENEYIMLAFHDHLFIKGPPFTTK